MPADEQKLLKQRYRVLKEFVKGADPGKLLARRVRTPAQAGTLAEDLDLAFDNWLTLGMCEWRHGQADPYPRLRTAYSLSIRAADVLRPYHEPDSPTPAFWFPPTPYVARLATGFFDKHLLAMVPEFPAWRSGPLSAGYADAAHLNALQTGAYPGDWPDLIRAFTMLPGYDLFCETNLTYERIITGVAGHSPQRAADGVRVAYDLFPKREHDPFYADVRMAEGGGDANGLVVDYRLATIIEHLFGAWKHLFMDLPPTHVWRFWPKKDVGSR